MLFTNTISYDIVLKIFRHLSVLSSDPFRCSVLEITSLKLATLLAVKFGDCSGYNNYCLLIGKAEDIVITGWDHRINIVQHFIEHKYMYSEIHHIILRTTWK